MRPKVVELHFETALEHQLHLVLDGTTDSWLRIRQVGLELLERLPGRIDTISFLGSDTCHHISLPADFDRQTQDLIRQHGNRPALLNPVAEAWQQERSNDYLVVISKKSPIDFDDWVVSGRVAAAGLVFVNLSGEEWGGVEGIISGSDPVSPLEQRTSNPPLFARVSGDGFFPLQVKVNQGKPGLEYVAPDIRLKIDDLEPTGRLSLRVKGLALSKPNLVFERRDLSRETIEGHEIPSYFQQQIWTPLAEQTARVINAGIGNTTFSCPFCGEPHGGQDIFCPRGKMLLGDLPLHSTILFRGNSYLSLDDMMPAYLLDGGETVISRDGRLYDWNQYEWSLAREIEPYEEVAHGIHALYTDF